MKEAFGKNISFSVNLVTQKGGHVLFHHITTDWTG